MFSTSKQPIVDLIRRFCEHRDLPVEGAHVLLSVPTSVLSDDVKFEGVLEKWSFAISKAQASLKLKSLDVMNDMVALGFAIPELRGDYRLIGTGVPINNFPICAVAVRSEVGALAMVLANPESAKARWIPVQSEAGFIELAPKTEIERQVLDALYSGESLAKTASDILSANGVMSIYQILASKNNVAPIINFDIEKIVERAKASDNEGMVAKQTIELWCSFFGNFVRSLCLAFGSQGGAYIAGRLPNEFLAPQQIHYQSIFRSRFSESGPTKSYLSDIPTALITHSNPYLKGLARIVPSNFQD